MEIASVSLSEGSELEKELPSGNATGSVNASSGDSRLPEQSLATPVPRPKRRSRRPKEDRGLPNDEELAKLATFYLERQRKLWPTFANAGLLPVPSNDVINRMVDEFKKGHRTGQINVTPLRPFVSSGTKLGGAYSRYSCENSTPTSIVDQLAKELDKAHSEGRFIPWIYVFADFSVTGLDSKRQGYSSYKKALAANDSLIETTYIDDFTRASRDEIEWWKLAQLSKRLNRRMIGASDGFNLNDPNWDIHITIFGLVSRLFIKGLREKVRRGMKGAAGRGTCLGRLPLGFTKRARIDAAGSIVLGADGLPIYERCICPETRDYRLLLYTLFTQKKWSTYKIAKHFNSLKVDGWDGWLPATISELLHSPSSIGVFIWNKTRREFDYETKKYVVVENPRSQWEVHYDRSLAIVPLEMYRAARRALAKKRAASPLTGKMPSRNENSATTLFSGTLFCKYCNKEIKLIRSVKEHKQLGCVDGSQAAHDCPLSTSKSARIIEESLLGFLREKFLTKSRMKELAAQAKTYIEEEARKPRVAIAPLRAQLHTQQSKLRKLVIKVEETDDEELSQAYHHRVLELQKEVNVLNEAIREASVQNCKRETCFDEACVLGYLDDLRGLLDQDVAAAADSIRQLTGRITISNETSTGNKREGQWVATFSPSMVRLLRHLKRNDATVDLLAQVDEAKPIEVFIHKCSQYESLGPKFLELRQNGASMETIARTFKTSRNRTRAILHFASTGEWPDWQRNANGACGRENCQDPGHSRGAKGGGDS